MSATGAELNVKGFVQGVGYRYFCYRRALALGLSGWVKNQSDGSVGILVEGDRGAIEGLIEELKVGPSAAHVTGVTVRWVPFTGKYHRFEITH